MSAIPHRAPWTPLHAQLHQTLRSRQLVKKHQRLLVAVSGGQDSLCLIKLLLDLQSKWNWHLAIAHCDHRWRSDSQGNADYVEQLAHQWQLPFFRQVAEIIPQTEAAAREWRYHVLQTLAETHDYEAVLTGHTASDRAETLLYNLMRGSSADGLQALSWQRRLSERVQLVRPMLEMQRVQTADFCRTFALLVWEDLTNQDVTYARNRIRHELLPYLQEHFNPKIERTLAQTAEILRAEVDYLEASATSLAQQVLCSKPPGLNRHLLQEVPLALQRRVVRQFLQQHLQQASHFEHIEKLIALLQAPNRSQTDPLPGGAIAVVKHPWIWLIPEREITSRSG